MSFEATKDMFYLNYFWSRSISKVSAKLQNLGRRPHQAHRAFKLLHPSSTPYSLNLLSHTMALLGGLPPDQHNSGICEKVNSPHATLAFGSCFKWASKMASETWSHNLSKSKSYINFTKRIRTSLTCLSGRTDESCLSKFLDFWS